MLTMNEMNLATLATYQRFKLSVIGQKDVPCNRQEIVSHLFHVLKECDIKIPPEQRESMSENISSMVLEAVAHDATLLPFLRLENTCVNPVEQLFGNLEGK